MPVYKDYEDFKKSAIGGAKVYSKTGVAPDYINAWIVVGMIGSNNGNIQVERLPEKILLYENYLRQQNGQFVENVINDSDPIKISTLNSLADAFNTIRNQLVAEKNFIAIKLFFELADQLIRGS